MKLKMINLQDTSNYISYLFDKAWVFLFPLLCFILRFLLSVHFDYDILRDSGCLSGVSFQKFAREIGSQTVRLDSLRMPDVWPPRLTAWAQRRKQRTGYNNHLTVGRVTHSMRRRQRKKKQTQELQKKHKGEYT